MKSFIILILLSLAIFANENNYKINCKYVEPEVQGILDEMTEAIDSVNTNKDILLALYDDLNYYAVNYIECDESIRQNVLNAHRIVTDVFISAGYIK